MSKEFIIIRGISGSGKSTLAREIMKSSQLDHKNAVWCEADHFFHDFITGVYNFDPTKLPKAHAWCQSRIEEGLKDSDVHRVIVSNTFTTQKELNPYFELAKKYSVIPQVICVQGRFENVHDVPEEVLNKQRQRFDFNCVDVLYEKHGF